MYLLDITHNNLSHNLLYITDNMRLHECQPSINKYLECLLQKNSLFFNIFTSMHIHMHTHFHMYMHTRYYMDRPYR